MKILFNFVVICDRPVKAAAGGVAKPAVCMCWAARNAMRLILDELVAVVQRMLLSRS